MTFNQIKYFVTVAECLSFTEAAKCLFITQPALSRQITAIEEELGTQLFLRDKKRLKLTPGGAVLYNRWPELLELYSQTIHEAKTANQGYEGRLRIGFLDIYDISDLFDDVIREFQDRYRNIQFMMERYSLGELTDRLYDDTLDMILTYDFSLYDKPDLLSANVQKYNSMLMIGKDHPLADVPQIVLSDFKDEKFITLDKEISEEGYYYIKTLFSRCGIHPETIEVKKMEDIMLWVQTGNGVALTTNRTTERNNPHVVIREIPMEEARDHDITIAWCKNNYNPGIAIFLELLEQQCSVLFDRTSPTPKRRYKE